MVNLEAQDIKTFDLEGEDPLHMYQGAPATIDVEGFAKILSSAQGWVSPANGVQRVSLNRKKTDFSRERNVRDNA